MKLIHNAILFGFAVGAASLAACSEAPRPAPGAVTASDGQHGTVGMALQIGPGVTLSTVQYTITNPTLAGFSTIVNSVDVSGSQTISFTVTLPAGSGYTLSLSAVDDSGDPCSGGPVSFSVVGGQTNSVSLNLLCTRTVDGGVVGPDVNVGTVVFTGDASLETTVVGGTCAAVSSLSASPRETAVGHAISLAAVGIDASNQTSDVTLTWSATGGAGSLTGTTGTSNTFNCTGGGTEMVTVTAAISNGGASCAGIGSLSTTLTCDGPVDSGVSVPDTGVADTGAVDSGPADTGTVEAGPLVPCTTSGQTNCVQCNGNASNLCSPTEAAIVQHDITTGAATAPGAAPGSSCYACLFNGSCINDTVFGDTGHECEDPLTTFGTATECEATLACIFSTSCAATSVAACYCGTAGPTTTCQGNPATGPINGACDTTIAAGLGFAVMDGTDNTAKLENVAYASGRADQIFQCAIANDCTNCLH